MLISRRAAFGWFFLVTTAGFGTESRAQPDCLREPYPLATVVSNVRQNLSAAAFNTTNCRRDDYLAIVRGIVGHFRHFQNSDGSIIDPFLQKEVQYSTPCYAWAATALFISGKETALLDSAASALDSALEQLAEARTADNHGDFFTFPAMLAYENLRQHVSAKRAERWKKLLGQIDPRRAYRDVLNGNRKAVHNWNVVAIAGEFLRHQAGFTDLAFIEDHLQLQLEHFTAMGLYRDPNVPMAYDHFPRHFLAAMLQRGYAGKEAEPLSTLLERGAWTSLLMQSPLGELPTGGRSAQHQWNEAQQCVTYEIWAQRKQQSGDVADARAFKRAAQLALQSIQRWIRPSGELWIVKNRFDAAVRHGFENYSSHSQYNLLAASMLATAWLFADDSIPASASPADIGGFVVELPQFHKVIANAGGMYVEIETGADPHYNSTGLIRIHKAGEEPLVGPSDGTSIKNGALALGIAWPEETNWQSLAALDRKQIKNVRLSVQNSTQQEVRFSVRYELNRPSVKAVTENYRLTPSELQMETKVQGHVDKIRLRLPVLAFNGQRASRIIPEKSEAKVQFGESTEVCLIINPPGQHWRRTGSWVESRNGYLEAVEAEIDGSEVGLKIFFPNRHAGSN